VDIETALKSAMEIDGALGAAIVDAESGMALGTLGGDDHFDLEVAGAGDTVRAHQRVMAVLGGQDEVEDLLVTLGRQYHLVRVLRTARSGALLAYLALDRERADPEPARDELRRIEQLLAV
jgi:hypothetical protein